MNNMRIGVICDMSQTRSINMARCYHAIKNLFVDVNIINCKEDLKNINLLFISDPFFMPHRQIWMTEEFINECNLRKIKVSLIYFLLFLVCW